MLAAHRNAMTSGDYVFISLGLLPPDNVQQPWLRHDNDDDEAADAYFALLQVIIAARRYTNCSI